MILINFITIVILLIMLGVFGFILVKFINCIVKIIDKSALIVSKKVKSKIWLPILEVLYLSNLILYTIFSILLTRYIILISIIALIFILFIFELIQKLLPRFQGYVGVFVRLRNMKIFNCYIMERILMISPILGSFLFFLFSLIFIFICFTALKWPQIAYFAQLLIIPVFSILWVYLGRGIKLNEDKFTVTTKRCIIFLGYLCFTIYKSYDDFSTHFLMKEAGDKFSLMFYASIFVIWISMDRIMKEIHTDYIDYKDKTKK